MKTERIKEVLEAAAKLPPVKARALVAAVKNQEARGQNQEEDFQARAQDAFEAAMLNAALDALTTDFP